MKKILKKITNNKALLSFILSFLLGTLIILPTIIKGKGVYSLIADFATEQIPFNKMINDSIKSGGILWTWFNDLGSNFIGTFSFYNLFSPFNIIGYIFPSSIYEYLIGPIFILKYAISGLTSYLFLKRYVKNKNYAILGSLLYSFSGFQLTNVLFYHFHDIVAFFPLMLYTLDNLVYDNKKGFFTLSVFLNALTNWFFFIGEVIFILIYFIIKVLTKEYKINLKKFLTIFFESLLGVLLSLFVLLPTSLMIIENPRVSSTWNFIDMIKYPFIKYLEIFRSLIFVPDNMSIRSIITEYNHSSIEAYLPVIGIVFSLTYLLKNPKKWSSILTITSLIFMLVPILNSSFFLFTTTYYARWFFMPTLILTLMSIKSIEENYKPNIGIIVSLISITLFIIILFLYNKVIMNVIFNMNHFLIIIILTYLNIFITYFISKTKKKKILYYILSIFIFITIYGNFNTYLYRGKYYNTDYYNSYFKENESFQKYKNSRFNSTSSCEFNIGYINKIQNLKVFNSNISGGAFKFYNSLNLTRNVQTIIPVLDKDLNDFLSIEYIISCNEEEVENYSYIETIDNYKIYKNNEYLPIGFVLNDYILDSVFMNLSYIDKIKVLKEKIVIDETNLEKYKYLFNNEKLNYEVSDILFTKDGLKLNVETNLDGISVLQIPYDKGFKVYLNKKEVTPLEIDNGLMGIKVNKGDNLIELKYMPKGLKIGIIISLISGIIYIVYILINKKEVI